MTEVMMTLGTFRFSIETAAYRRLQRTCEYRWPAQARAGRRPARQFTGIGRETIGLEGEIYPHFRGGLDRVENLRAQAGQGKALLLTDGRGQVWGRWCIERIEETQTYFWADGTARKIEFRLQLARYGADA